MKLSRFLPAAWLTAMVLALVPQYRRSEAVTPSVGGVMRDYINIDPILDAHELRDELAEQPYFEDPYVTLGPNSTHKSAPAYQGAILPPDVTGWNTTTPVRSKTGIGANSTSSVDHDSPALAGFLSQVSNAGVRIGKEKQHIGTLRKNRLEKAIFECLKTICPLDDPKRGMNPCTVKNTKSCVVENIVYNAKPHPKYATNSNIRIQIDWAYHNPEWKGLGETAYRAVSSLYRIMSDMQDGTTDDGKTKTGACQPVDFPGSRRTLLCNVPRSASFAFPVNDDHLKGDTSEIQAMVAVSIYFNGDTIDGDYNVIRVNPRARHAIDEKFNNDWRATIAKEVGHPAQDIGIKIDLLDIDKSNKCQSWFWYEDANC